jgi:hypothetical protein
MAYDFTKWSPQGQAGFFAAPGQFAEVLGGNYGNYVGGMAQTGKNYTDAFGAYNMGLGNMATARANERSNMYGANAMAEAARQGTLSNIGTAALGAYGSASNSALAAWAANQQAYNRSAADMHTANQQAMGNVGVSRNQALGSLGAAYGGIGRAEIGANALSNLNLNASGDFGGGGGFSATGPGGPLASGSYGGGGGGGFSLSGSRSSSSGGGGSSGALSGLGDLRRSVMDPDIPNRIDNASQAGRNQLDAQHYSSRNMPSEMLGQTLQGLMTLGSPAYKASGAGMDQFYQANQFDERPYESMRGDLNRGFTTVGNQIGGVQRGIEGGYATANQQVNDLFDNSLRRHYDPTNFGAQRDREAELARRRWEDEDIAAYESEVESLGSAWRNVAPGQYTHQEYMAMGDQERMALAARRREAERIAARETLLAQRAGRRPWSGRNGTVSDMQSSPFYTRPIYIEEFVPRSPGSPWGQTVRRHDPLAGLR